MEKLRLIIFKTIYLDSDTKVMIINTYYTFYTTKILTQ